MKNTSFRASAFGVIAAAAALGTVATSSPSMAAPAPASVSTEAPATPTPADDTTERGPLEEAPAEQRADDDSDERDPSEAPASPTPATAPAPAEAPLTPTAPNSRAATTTYTNSAAITGSPTRPGDVSDWIDVKLTYPTLLGYGSFTAPEGTTIEAIEARWNKNDVLEDSVRIANNGRTATIKSREWLAPTSLFWGSNGLYLKVKLRVSPTAPPQSELSGGDLTIVGVLGITQDRTDVPVFTAGMSATPTTIDIPGRSSQLTGQGDPGSLIVLNGKTETLVGDDGVWTATVGGLTLGSNPVTVEQFANGLKTDSAVINVDLRVAPLGGTVSMPAEIDAEVIASGTAQAGSQVVLTNTSGHEVARTTTATDGTWSTPVTAPGVGGKYTLTAHQEVDGEPNGNLSLTVAYGPAVSITSPVDGAAHDGGLVTMSGTGEAGATVTVREQGTEAILGATTASAGGTWTLKTTTLDDYKHVLEVTQSGKGNNTTRSTVTLNPDNEKLPVIVAPTVVSPAAGSTVTTSRPTFSGTGQEGAVVTIGYNAKSIIGTGVVEDGKWTIAPTRGLGMGVSTLVVTQTAGDDVQTVTHTITRVAAEQPLRVTSHASEQTYIPGKTTFRGTAPVGSTIRATNQWGTVMGATTATDGTWSFVRNLGPTTTGYDITFVATPPTGAPQTVSLKLIYAGTLAFQVSSPKNNSTYAVGTTTFTGTAAPGTTITATNQWGTPMGRAETGLGTTWSFDRYLGPTGAGYDITFVATKGTQTQRTTLHLNSALTNVPVAVTSHADGATYRPGKNILTGTGTPGATVKAVNAKNNWNVPMGQTKVDADGTWALPERNWGPSNDYAIKVTQTNPDKTTSTTTVNVTAPVFAPLVLTSPAVGDTYDNDVAATFTGTATPFATVAVSSATSDTTFRTVEADAQGNWSFTRTWGPDHDYLLTITQKALDGQTGTPITGFAWNSSGN
ncbi:Ig-like domain-containing protein [Frigoribacterium sp. VKM Ac-2836]|uniref:Ig-like domain-containing protein n=1 Tax=Frigoribacterium sp. VKM Ac-2836 TaxID=2739014 RepID=UPI001563B77A|nr:Ig-like domain-containing protein [Frigoribacterium sp. VKM Ac-2836]NRD27880.1 hypothetical protein [Frigoribacterium sp. VKM Ac-2836]